MSTRYGHFSAAGDEYVITRPDTPRPWQNHLGHAEYGMKVSQTGAGLSLHGSGRPVSLLFHAMRLDQPGRYVYLRDRDGGEVWSLNWQPCRRDYDRFECRHGLAHTIIRSARGGIDGSIRYFVPIDESVEIWTITVRNTGRKRRRIALYPYCEWAQKIGLPHGDDLEYACFSDARWLAGENLLLARYHESRPTFEDYVSFMAPDFKPDGYETSWARFVGPGLSRGEPAALGRPRLACRDTSAEVTIAALQKNLALAPGGEATVNVMIGLADRPAERRRLVRKLLSPGAAERAYQACRRRWDELAGRARIRTPDRKLDRTVNFWAKKQAFHCGVGTTIRTYRRGFRDTMQDAWAILTLDPAAAAAHIETAARFVFADGEAARAWTGKGDGDYVRMPKKDLKLWLVFAAAEYVKATGDFAILDAASPYLESNSARPHRLIDKLHRIAERSVRDVGRHGLSHIGHGDWNDALDAAGAAGRGESVWLTEALVGALRDLAGICAQFGDGRSAARYRRQADAFVRRINAAGWDGAWYLQGYDDAGRPIGSRRDREGACFLMPQAWALIAGVAGPRRTPAVVRTIRKTLMTEFGPRVLLRPYRGYRPNIGRLSQLRPGMCENGGVWSHAAAFAARGLLAVGRPEDALDIFHRVSPFNHDPARTHAEPYAYSNMYRGAECGPDLDGRTFVAWKTSTAGCLYLAMLERLVGLRPDYAGLRIDPCIPRRWKRCSATVSYRNATYAVTIRNPRRAVAGVRAVTVDGHACAGALVPWLADGQAHKVDVEMG